MKTVEAMAQELRAWLSDARFVLLVGLGNVNRGDDAAGVTVAEALKGHTSSRLKVMSLGEAVSNLLPDAVDLRPSHIIVVDAADLGGNPGSLTLARLDDLEGIRPTSTHDLPVRVAVGLVTSQVGADAVVIGIQPKERGIGCAMSEEVRLACDQVARLLEDVLTLAGLAA